MIARNIDNLRLRLFIEIKILTNPFLHARDQRRRDQLQREAEARERERQSAIRRYNWEDDARSRYTPPLGKAPHKEPPCRSTAPGTTVDPLSFNCCG
jgi:hypothetical protein